MVRLVNLEATEEDSLEPAKHSVHGQAAIIDSRPNPNLNGLSAALSCYP